MLLFLSFVRRVYQFCFSSHPSCQHSWWATHNFRRSKNFSLSPGSRGHAKKLNKAWVIRFIGSAQQFVWKWVMIHIPNGLQMLQHISVGTYCDWIPNQLIITSKPHPCPFTEVFMHINPTDTSTGTTNITLSLGFSWQVWSLWIIQQCLVLMTASFQVYARHRLIKSPNLLPPALRLGTLLRLSGAFVFYHEHWLIADSLHSPLEERCPSYCHLHSFHWPDTKHTLRKPLEILGDCISSQPLPHLRHNTFPIRQRTFPKNVDYHLSFLLFRDRWLTLSTSARHY